MKRLTAFLFLTLGTSQASWADSSALKMCLESDPYVGAQAAVVLCGPAVDTSVLDAKTLAEVSYRKGAAQYWLGDWKEAVKTLTIAVEADPTHEKARLRRGWAYKQNNQYDLAFQEFSELASMGERSARGVFGVGFLYGEAGQRDKQLAAYRQAVQMDPDYHYARMSLIELEYQIDQDPDKAAKAFAAMLQIGEEKLNTTEYSYWFNYPYLPRFRDFIHTEYRIYLRRSRNYKEALAQSSAMADIYPDLPNPLIRQAEDLNTLGRHAEAHEKASLAIKMCQKSWRYDTCELAIAEALPALIGLKRYKEAKELAETFLEYHVAKIHRAAPSFYLGVAMRALGQPAEAKRYVLEAAQINPEWGQVILTQLIQRGFYEGETTDEISDRVLNGLDACVIDDDCFLK